MSNKTYTLELTAEELEHPNWGAIRGYPRLEKVVRQILDLQEQARQDRAADELRLPWRARNTGNCGWDVRPQSGSEFPCVGCCGTERMAKLASAAPELLEAVQAVQSFMRVMNYGLSDDVGDLKVATPAGIVSIKGLVDRALRKVDTGIPEEK